MFDATKPFKCTSTTAWLNNGALVVNWSGNYGWGQVTFGFDAERNKIICDSECMGKESVTEILRQMVEDSVVLSDVKVNGEFGEWVKKVRILEGLEAGLVFESIMLKQYGSRCHTKFHRELGLFEDRWENDGKIFCVFSHESQNTEHTDEARWMDIDTFTLGAPQDRIKVIKGFTRIEEWSWGCGTNQQGNAMILSIGKPIPRAKSPKNIYRLTITNMHGDADAETVNTYDFKAEEVEKEAEYGLTLFELLSALHFYDGLHHGQQCDFCYSSNKRRELMSKAGLSDKVIDNITDYMDGDCTNDGNTLAMFDGWTLTYFNGAGVEHEVNIQI